MSISQVAFAAPQEAPVSPKSPWGEFTVSEEEGQVSDGAWWKSALLWIPNRVMDLVDVFRLDIGAGPALGAVARVSNQGQIGYREISPFSMRVGLFGRNPPVLVETSNEFGIGPGYVNSKDRKVCRGEVGLGADLLLGIYGGICIEEALDFLAGIVFVDVLDDDIKA